MASAEEKQLTTQGEKKPSQSERFTAMVMQEYGKTGSNYHFTDREKQLIRNYFISIDQMLAKTEAERLRKNSTNRDAKFNNELAYSWQTIDLPQRRRCRFRRERRSCSCQCQYLRCL